MASTINATAPPLGHPTIPPGIPHKRISAIITIHHDNAPNANRAIQHDKLNTARNGGRATRQGANGVHIFLRQKGRNSGQYCFNFGRERDANIKSDQDRDDLDAYLPGPANAVGVRQFSLVPVWACNCWRLQSTSEIIAAVNGVPIQVYNTRTKNQENPLPQAVYLKQSEVNHVIVNGMWIDIWLMNSVRQIYGPQEYTPPNLNPQSQNVANRPEPWALERWNLTQEQVSSKTFRVIHRFTGEKETAKVIQTGQRRWQLRNQEFVMFNKQEVDESVVRYLNSTEFSMIPAVITDFHEGLVTYASLRDELRQSHPGNRFEIATKLIRRLYCALSFMHFHSILHNGVSNESVLMRMVDGKVARVLLVDYSTARPFPLGEALPVDGVIDDSQAVMELIEDCCDIWAFRSGPTTAAQSEYIMQRRTTELHEQYMIVKRASADFFGPQGGSRMSEKGKKLIRLANTTGNDWIRARNAQAQNLLLREVAALSKSKIDAKVAEWNSVNAAATCIGQEHYMLLSLGHPYLDSLSTKLYFKRWDITAHEVCSKFKEFGGHLENPWQTVEVRKATYILPAGAGYTEDSIMTWLATCCEIHPEWRQAIDTEFERNVQVQTKVIDVASIGALYAALQGNGRLPGTMVAMFNRLLSTDAMPNLIEETYQIWCHIPSRLFNLTQLHRLVTPERLQTVITEGQIQCDNFVEVRGDPKIQGCYASFSLLAPFCDVFALGLPKAPAFTAIPTLDPSDFSRVLPGRIVLARLGMLGYGSMIRSAEQVNWLNPKAPESFETPSMFIPTNFGDMKVIPELPYKCIHERPEHWSKYKMAEETEASMDVSKRNILSARTLGKGKGRATRIEIDAMEMDIDIDVPPLHVQESTIAKYLRERDTVRATAQFATKRVVSPSPLPPASLKRGRKVSTLNLPLSHSFMQRMEDVTQGLNQPAQPELSSSKALSRPGISFGRDSFMDRNSALMVVPPNDPTNVNQSFTVADDDETLEEDWKVVDTMLKSLPDDEEEYPTLTGFNLDAIHAQNSRDTENAPEIDESFEATEVDPTCFPANMYTFNRAARSNPFARNDTVPNSPIGPTGMYSNVSQYIDEDMLDTDVET